LDSYQQQQCACRETFAHGGVDRHRYDRLGRIRWQQFERFQYRWEILRPIRSNANTESYGVTYTFGISHTQSYADTYSYAKGDTKAASDSAHTPNAALKGIVICDR
jgi:hypothetical protein